MGNVVTVKECPVCGSRNTASKPCREGGYMVNAKCNDCGSTWRTMDLGKLSRDQERRPRAAKRQFPEGVRERLLGSIH